MQPSSVPAEGSGIAPEVARPLRNLRLERWLSPHELARLAKVAPSTIYMTEVGRTTPRPAVMRALATALGVDPLNVAEFRRAIEAAKMPRSS
jgi:transcriptional regulator with XRE-family HTH domain